MALRKKSGNILGGSLLNVDGQGIYNVKKFQLVLNKSKKSFVIEPTQTPTISPTDVPSPPTPTPTPTFIPTDTPTPTPTPCPTTPTYYVSAQYDMLSNQQRIFLLPDFDFGTPIAATCSIDISYSYLSVPTTADTPTTSSYNTGIVTLPLGNSSVLIVIEDYFYDFYITSVTSCVCENILIWDHRIVTVGASSAEGNVLGYHSKPNQAADNWFTGYTSGGNSLFGYLNKGLSVATNGTGTWLAVGEGPYPVIQNTYLGLTALWDYITPGNPSAFDTAYSSVEYGYDNTNTGIWLLSTVNTKEIISSQDLINWNHTASGLNGPIFDFANGKDGTMQNLWIGVGNWDGTNNAVYSQDGISWNVFLPASATFINLRGVGYNEVNNTWMVVGSPPYTLVSSDGSNFNFTSSLPGFDSYCYSITYSPELGLWCAVGEPDTNNIFLSNDDGDTWTGATSVPHSNPIYNVTWDGYNFIAVGIQTIGLDNNIIYSQNGFNWFNSTNGGDVLGDGNGVASVRAPGLYPPR